MNTILNILPNLSFRELFKIYYMVGWYMVQELWFYILVLIIFVIFFKIGMDY